LSEDNQLEGHINLIDTGHLKLSSAATGVFPPPGGLHRLRRHAEVIEEQQQQALGAAGVCDVQGGRDFCRVWWRRALEVLLHEGEQIGLAQARPAAQAVLTAEGLQLGLGEAVEREIQRQQEAWGCSQQGLVAVVDALSLAVEVGIEAAGVAGEDAAEGLEVGAEAVADRGAAAAGAARRDSEPRKTGGRPVAMAEHGRYAVVAVVRWLELTRLRKSAHSPDRYGDIYSGAQP